MRTRTTVLSGALLAALLGIAPRPSCAAIKPEDLTKVQAAIAALPANAPATPAKPRKILIYTRSTGFVHSSIDLGAETLRLLGEKTGAYTATISNDPAAFDPENLKQYDAIVFESTTNEPLKPKDGDPNAEANAKLWKQSLLDFISSGKGFIGIHAATDAYWQGNQKWTEYQQMIGGSFNGHPWHEEVGVMNQDPNHPVNAAFEGKDFKVTDEIYQMQNYARDKMRVLAGLDILKTNMNKDGINRGDGDFAVSWVKNWGQGRVFYCSLGHREEIYWNPVVLKHYLAGIQFAIGDLQADSSSLPLPARARESLATYRQTPQPARNVRDDLNGLYTGTYLPSKQAAVAPTPITARVVGWGGNEYRVVVDVPEGDKTKRVEIPAKKEGNKLTVGGNAGGADWTGTFDNGKIALSGGGELELARVAKTSPTQGLKPPAAAVVLMPYEEGKPSNINEWNGQWQIMDDGSIQVNATGDLRTKREFGDMILHLEYKPPYKTDARGQGRGNSGVYLQDRYEVQVLDSFGWPPRDNEAGGIYQVAVPKANAALPPTEWQTYDMTFRAPRFNADGSVKTPATVTAYLNGQLIHDNVQIPKPTGGGAPNNVAKGALRLQDHQNPVRFRNIWVVEKNFADDAPLPDPLAK